MLKWSADPYRDADVMTDRALSNWGRWGEDDQLGTLNFIIPHTRLAAAALIRTGRVVPIGRTPYRRRQAATTSSA